MASRIPILSDSGSRIPIIDPNSSAAVVVAPPVTQPQVKVVQPVNNTTIVPPGFVGPINNSGGTGGGMPAVPGVTQGNLIQNTAPASAEFPTAPASAMSTPVSNLNVTGVNGSPVPKPPVDYNQEGEGLNANIDNWIKNNLPNSSIAEKALTGTTKFFADILATVATPIYDMTQAAWANNQVQSLQLGGQNNSLSTPSSLEPDQLRQERAIRDNLLPVYVDANGQTRTVLNDLPIMNKTPAQIAGDIAVSVLTVYAPELGTELLGAGFVEKAAGETLAKIFLKAGTKSAINFGLPYGVAQAVASGTTDPQKFADIVLQNAAVAFAFGGVLETAAPALVRVSEQVKKIQAGVIDDLVSKGYSQVEAKAIATQGGFLGKFMPNVQELDYKISQLQDVRDRLLSVDKPNKTLLEQNSKALKNAQIERSRIMQGGYVKNPFYSEPKAPEVPPGQKGQTPEPAPIPTGDIKSNESYTPTVPPLADNVKERAFLTSLKDNPVMAKAFADESSNYTILTNAESRANARALIDSNPDAARALAFSDTKSPAVATVRLTMLEDAAARGDWAEAKKLGMLAAPEATEAGQFIQIHSMLNQQVDTPAKAILTAGQAIEKHNSDVMPKFEGKINQVEKEFNNVTNEAVDKIISETPELHLKPAEQQALADIAKTDPQEVLAKKISAELEVNKPGKPNPVRDMINTLYKVAKEQLPKKELPVPKTQIELIGQALRDNETYKDIWSQAQSIVRNKYKDKPDVLFKLDQYFNKTLLSGETPHAALPIPEGMASKAVQQEMKTQQVNLGRIVREHYTVVDGTGADLSSKLIERANVPAKEAMLLAQKIQQKYEELVSAKKESILKTIFNKNVVRNDKSFVGRMIELSNLGAFDKVQFKEQVAEKLGLSVMTEGLARQLSEKANVIQTLPFGYEKFKASQELLKLISDQTPMTKLEMAGQILNVPRTIMSSFDYSFGLRQGLVGAVSHPKEFWASWTKQFGMAWDEKAYEKVMDLTMKHPDFALAEKSGVSFTDIGSAIGKREERYQSQLAEKIPFVGRGVRASARAYTGMANKMRMDIYASMLDDAERLGFNPRTTDLNLAEDLAKTVNTITGRGELSKNFLGTGIDLNKGAPIFNAIFFSPRLTASRLSMLNPAFYATLEPAARKQALKSLFALTGTMAVVLGAAKISGLEVGTDWRSSDLGKIKIGNTRIDITGGFQQYFRMAGQLYTGQYVSSTTGKEYTLGEGYKPMTRLDIIGRQFTSKESPIASFVTDWLRGTDQIGNKNTVGSLVGSRLIPIVSTDIYDIWKDDPRLLPLGLTSVFGVGVQTYSQPQDKNSSSTGRLKLPGPASSNNGRLKLPGASTNGTVTRLKLPK